MRYKKKTTAVLLMIIIACYLFPTGVFAAGFIDTDRDVSVCLSYYDETEPIPDTEFRFYRVADVDKFGQMSLTTAFSAYPISLDNQDADGWNALALTLKGFVLADGISAYVTGTTDEDGTITCNAKPGLYLVLGNNTRIGDYMYSALPFLAFLPGQNLTENVWDYSVSMNPKNSKVFDPEPITRRVLKIWNDEGYENLRPERVTVNLLNGEEVYDTRELSQENDWRYEWDDLDPYGDWIIVEETVDGYYPVVALEGITFTVTNKYVVPRTEEELQVLKQLTGDTPSVPAVFTFTLTPLDDQCPMPEGSSENGKEITITGSGSAAFGRFEFAAPGEFRYSVSEKNAGEKGYTYDTTVYTVLYSVTQVEDELFLNRSITKSDGQEVSNIVFTNKYIDPGNRVPDTGVLWWPVPIMITLGIAFCILGVVSRKGGWNEKENSEKNH